MKNAKSSLRAASSRDFSDRCNGPLRCVSALQPPLVPSFPQVSPHCHLESGKAARGRRRNGAREPLQSGCVDVEDRDPTQPEANLARADLERVQPALCSVRRVLRQKRSDHPFDALNLPCLSQDASSTICRTASAAAQGQFGVHPRNDLDLMGAINRALMSSIALFTHLRTLSAHSHNTPTAGAASPLQEEALGFDSPVVDSWASTSSTTSEGARQPRKPELGAQMALSLSLIHI